MFLSDTIVSDNIVCRFTTHTAKRTAIHTATHTIIPDKIVRLFATQIHLSTIDRSLSNESLSRRIHISFFNRLGQDIFTHGKTLHPTTTHYNTLQHTATRCNTLQHTATNSETDSPVSFLKKSMPCGQFCFWWAKTIPKNINNRYERNQCISSQIYKNKKNDNISNRE